MQRNAIGSSSNIKSAGYDEQTGRLEIEFHNGSLYSYDEVPQEKFDALIAADGDENQSVGRYFNQQIRGQFKGTKVEREEAAA